jgi:hypothetical protein
MQIALRRSWKNPNFAHTVNVKTRKVLASVYPSHSLANLMCKEARKGAAVTTHLDEDLTHDVNVPRNILLPPRVQRRTYILKLLIFPSLSCLPQWLPCSLVVRTNLFFQI